MSDTDSAPEDLRENYSRALDEIFELRNALAYEAGVIRAHLSYKTFPKTRRDIAEGQIERMREAARGHVRRAYAEVSHLSLRWARTEAGAEHTLTASQWQQEAADRKKGA